MIGTGASAVQFVPEIARDVGHLTVFQRTGNWFMPRRNRAYPPVVAWAIRHVPGVQAFRRRFIYQYGESLTLMIRHPRTFGLLGRARSTAFMRWQLRDPELRRKVWPDYTFGCKRVLFSSPFLPALQRPNVALVTEPIERDDAGRPADGRRRGARGRLRHLRHRLSHERLHVPAWRSPAPAGDRCARTWAQGPHAHLGMTVPGFPSLFVMYGPNTNTSGGSIIVYLEAQAAYIRQALALVRDRGAAAIDVRPEVEAASDRAVQERFAGTAWTRCDSWYRDRPGGSSPTGPGYMREYEQRTAVLDPERVHAGRGSGRRRPPSARTSA